jgi:hypothetical protein
MKTLGVCVNYDDHSYIDALMQCALLSVSPSGTHIPEKQMKTRPTRLRQIHRQMSHICDSSRIALLVGPHLVL